MEAEAFITIGLPACGKSTWAKTVPCATRIERDIFRVALFKERGLEFSWGAWDMGLEGEVTKRWEATLKRAMSRRERIVVSDTNLAPARRKELAKRLISCGYRVRYVFFDVPEDVCRKANSVRGRFAVQEEAYRKLSPFFLMAKETIRKEAEELGVGLVFVRRKEET